MEIRILEYFLAVAKKESISKAAEYLHITQPTLSRQIRDLENELGKKLFDRGSRKIILTEDGILLRKRAEEIVDLVKKAENEVKSENNDLNGDIFIGAAETDAARIIIKSTNDLQKQNKKIRLHIFSGDAHDTLEKLDKGLIDFALLLGQTDSNKYNVLKLPVSDTWGLLMKKDSLLSEKEFITPEDLKDKPLILSRQSQIETELKTWLNSENIKPDIVATYNLIYNAALMVDEGMGYALTLDKLINFTGGSNLKFTPLKPQLSLEASVIWKKSQIFSKPAEAFLNNLKRSINTL